MDMDLLQSLDKLPLEKAREVATSLIDVKKTKKIVRLRLENDIARAHSSAEVSRIMWQVYLSGSGLGTVGSKWKEYYNSF